MGNMKNIKKAENIITIQNRKLLDMIFYIYANNKIDIDIFKIEVEKLICMIKTK